MRVVSSIFCLEAALYFAAQEPSGAQTNATTSWAMDTTTTTTSTTRRTPRRCALISYDIYRVGECVCKVEHESASAVGVCSTVAYSCAPIVVRLAHARTRIAMHIIDASVRSPEAFSPEALSARNTEEERRSSEVEPPPVGWPWPWPPSLRGSLWRSPPDGHRWKFN